MLSKLKINIKYTIQLFIVFFKILANGTFLRVNISAENNINFKNILFRDIYRHYLI